MFVDISSVDLSKLSKEELLSFREFVRARINKHGAHLLRLLRMGIEFLNDGELHVLRQDAQQLLEIKRGEWSLEKVKEEAERLFISAETAYTLSKLPDRPDREKVNKLCVEIATEYFFPAGYVTYRKHCYEKGKEC